MAREHARILCSIWRPGDDFRQRSPAAQRLYFLLLSQRELNNAGVMPLMLNKWSRMSPDTTADDVGRALDELTTHAYVVVDETTEELLIRTFIRNDGVARQPNVLKSALRLVRQIESPKLRSAVARELARLGHPDAMATAAEIAPEDFPQPDVNPSPNPSGNPSHDPEQNPSATPERNPSADPAGWGGGRGRGKGSSSRGGSVGGDAQTRDPDPPPPAPNLDPNNPRCGKHAHIPATDPGPGCHACRAVRRHVEAEPVTDAVIDEHLRFRAAVDACEICDDTGHVEREDGSPARCPVDDGHRLNLTAVAR